MPLATPQERSVCCTTPCDLHAPLLCTPCAGFEVGGVACAQSGTSARRWTGMCGSTACCAPSSSPGPRASCSAWTALPSAPASRPALPSSDVRSPGLFDVRQALHCKRCSMLPCLQRPGEIIASQLARLFTRMPYIVMHCGHLILQLRCIMIGPLNPGFDRGP